LPFGRALALGAGFAAAMEVVTSAMEALRPALDAFLAPLTLVGQYIGQALAPILKALTPVIQVLAIATTYVAQVLLNVVGGIAIAVGSVLKSIIDTSNKIRKLFGKDPRSTDSARELQEAGREMLKAAGAMSEARKAIRSGGLGEAVEDLANQIQNVASSLTNVPAMLQVERLRAQAAGPVAIGTGGTKTLPERPTIARQEVNNTYNIIVPATQGMSASQWVDEVGKELKRRAGSFGSNAQSLAQAWPA
jgi:phage-related protein